MTQSHKSEKDALLRKRAVLVRGEIDDANANDVIARLLYLKSLSLDDPINLLIESPGGLVTAGLAIVHTIETLGPPIFTHCDSSAGGIALVILTRGRPGSRTAKSTAVLTFEPPVADDTLNTEKAANAIRFKGILVRMVSEATGRSESDVSQYFSESRTFTGHQAAKQGIIDRTKS